MAKTLELYFNAEVGTEKITIRNPIEDLDPATIKAAMDIIVEKNIFGTKSGDFVSPKSARYIDRTIEDIEFE